MKLNCGKKHLFDFFEIDEDEDDDGKYMVFSYSNDNHKTCDLLFSMDNNGCILYYNHDMSTVLGVDII